jgi:hypothetical protein
MLRVLPLGVAFLALAVGQVLFARGASEDQALFLMLAAMAVAAVGSVIVAVARRKAAAWIAAGAFVVALASSAIAVAAGGERAFEIGWSIAPVAFSGGVVALVALRGGDWAPLALLAGLGQLIVLPPPPFAEIPFERISELCTAHSGVLGVAIQLLVAAAAVRAAAKRPADAP